MGVGLGDAGLLKKYFEMDLTEAKAELMGGVLPAKDRDELASLAAVEMGFARGEDKKWHKTEK